MTKNYHYELPSEVTKSAPNNHTRVLTKPFLRQLYGEWYEYFIEEMERLPEGMKIELGSGSGFFKKIMPSIISTDSQPFPTNDLTFSPSTMPFNSDSVSGIFMIDTFSKIKDTQAFLTEAQRVLKPGGKMIMVEPATSIWGRVAHRLFNHKSFDRSGTWSNTLSASQKRVNSALPYIVFERDRSRFQNEFPALSLKNMTYHTPFRYFVGGGNCLNSAIVPASSYPFFSQADAWLSGRSWHWSMFVTVEIKKKSEVE